MMNLTISHARPALIGAAIGLLVVFVALTGLARLNADEPAPPTRAGAPPTEQVSAPPTELVAGTIVFDGEATAAERRRHFIGGLLAFFSLGGALCALAFGALACVLARRAALDPQVGPSAIEVGEAVPRHDLAREI